MSPDEFVTELVRRSKHGAYNGRLDTKEKKKYFERCKGYDIATGTIAIFTRDYGYHTSGWWKNPDYEFCLHLSLSFRDPETGQPIERDKKLSAKWCELFFKDSVRLIWGEPPYTPEGQEHGVWHYRVFTDSTWTVPILPRGEVYSKEFTERGWMSFSELGYRREQFPLGAEE